MRLMMAFTTMKSLIKICRDAGVALTVPIKGTRDELRMSLSADDKLLVKQYVYDPDKDELNSTTKPEFIFDENDPDQLAKMTNPDHGFLPFINSSLNTIMDNQYEQFDDTMRNGTNILRNAGRWLIGDRERMKYKANPRFLR